MHIKTLRMRNYYFYGRTLFEHSFFINVPCRLLQMPVVSCISRSDADGGSVPIPVFLRQHRTIASARFGGSFPPILRFEKLEIHTVFLRFSNLGLTKNLSPNLLAGLCGAALKQLTILRNHKCPLDTCFCHAQKGQLPQK